MFQRSLATRRRSVHNGRTASRVGAAVAVFAMLLSGATSASSVAAPGSYAGYDYVSRPDLHPPLIDVRVPASGTAPGYLFLTPAPSTALNGGPSPAQPVQSGAMLADDAGQPVWFAPPAQGLSASLQVQQYQGQPVLTWWEGKPVFPPGMGEGRYVIADSSYREIASVNAGNGMAADLHEFVITPQNTGLLSIYRPIKRDLSGIGGPKDATVLEGVVQEVDIANGRVLFEWHSADHVREDESFEPLPPDPATAYDYFHLNSVTLDGEGNLLVSARNTHGVYQVNRATGAVNWRLGGKKSDFRIGPNAAFAWQHDARRQSDGSISIFDNAAGAPVRDKSRAIALRVDETARTAELARENQNPDNQLSPNQGNAQALPNANLFVGWGAKSSYTEFGQDGQVRMHAAFRDRIASYRTFRFPWVGRPADAPAVAARTGGGTAMSVFTSWNGATEVRGWRLLAGPDPQNLHPVQDAPRTGFETKIDVAAREAYVATQALDGAGAVLGTSPAVPVTG